MDTDGDPPLAGDNKFPAAYQYLPQPTGRGNRSGLKVCLSSTSKVPVVDPVRNRLCNFSQKFFFQPNLVDSAGYSAREQDLTPAG